MVEVLDRLNDSLAADQAQDPGVRAALLNLSGDAYFRLGKPQLAVQTLKVVFSLAEIGGSEIDETATILSELILETQTQSRGPEPILWDLQFLLSQARNRQGEHQQALELAFTVYQARQKRLGENHPATQEAGSFWRQLKK